MEYIENYKLNNLNPEAVFSVIKAVYKKVKGSYSVILYIANQGIVAFRDPLGIRPLLFGVKKDRLIPSFAFASESVALDILGFEDIIDLEPGSAVFINKDRKIYIRNVQETIQ